MQDEISQALLRVARKDRAALRQLYALCAPKLTGILMRMLRDRTEVEDALQDVFIRVWDRAPAYDPEKGTGLNWLCAVARNHALDRLRAQRSRRQAQTVPVEDAVDLVSPGQGPEGQLLLRAEMENVVRCFGELPQDRAEAVKGAYLMGLSYQDLAERHEVPLNTMRTWLRRALITLKECLGR
ncbi:MAG: sigma-70 family RNA polymerase sigma factor [Roseinatronobacter sp.]